eukprot:1456509-Rhodomonas_salina.2
MSQVSTACFEPHVGGSAQLCVCAAVHATHRNRFSLLGFAAQLSVIMLLIGAFIYAHIIWLVERNDNPAFRKPYGSGIADAFWFAFVTATTAGYGDKVSQPASLSPLSAPSSSHARLNGRFAFCGAVSQSSGAIPDAGGHHDSRTRRQCKLPARALWRCRIAKLR